MIPTLTTLLKTVTGKVVVGVTVATMSVGAVAAAGAELPVLSDAPTAPADEESTEESSEESSEESTEESSEESTEESSEESTEESSEESTEESSEELTEESAEESTGESTEESLEEPEPADAASDDAGSEEAAANHGAVVSEFTRGTELTGCAKGQATAAVARGDVDPTALTDEELATALEEFTARCKQAEENETKSDNDTENAEAEVSGDDADGAAWKTVRDDTKATWHEAKDAFVAACGDDDGSTGDEESSTGCQAMKDELRQLHEAGKAEWKHARDEAKAERQSSSASNASKGDSAGKSNSGGKGNSGGNGNSAGKGNSGGKNKNG